MNLCDPARFFVIRPEVRAAAAAAGARSGRTMLAEVLARLDASVADQPDAPTAALCRAAAKAGRPFDEEVEARLRSIFLPRRSA